jgi:hypothetical protein
VIDIAYIIFIGLGFALGMIMGYFGGLSGWIIKNKRIKKAKDIKDLI